MACVRSASTFMNSFFFINLILALGGLTLLGIGISAQVHIVSPLMSGLQNIDMLVAPIVCITTGALVFTMAFFGYLYGVRNGKWVLLLYVLCMLVLMILKITLGATTFINLESFVRRMDIRKVLSNVFNKNRDYFQQNIEKTFQCCGVKALAYGTVSLPDTCCASAPCDLNNAYIGCKDKIAELALTYGFIIAVSYLCVAAIELVTILCAVIPNLKGRITVRKESRTVY